MIAAISLLLSFLCPPASELERGGCLDLTPADVVYVYDGDTIFVELPGVPPLFSPMPVRLLGFDTPEIRGRCLHEKDKAIEAKVFVERLISDASNIRLLRVQRGKFFRLMAEMSVDGTQVKEKLISQGLAREYFGGTRQGWCE